MHSAKLSVVLAFSLALLTVPKVRAQLTNDCAADSTHTVFFAVRSDGMRGSGTKRNPLDGRELDSILRRKSEAGEASVIVCLGPGTFNTKGVYDYIIGIGHQGVIDYKYAPAGFTVGRNWRIHGAGSNETGTVLRLSDVYRRARSGIVSGLVFGTVSDSASGVEISDLEIDDNYSAIGKANLAAINLRSDGGGHWIHRVKVINAESEGSDLKGKFYETFPVSIMSVNFQQPPSQKNLIEYVTMSNWGGGHCTAISMANAVGEVRNNTVNGYQVAFGGWALSAARFHDNTSIGSQYGFNIDSDVNEGVVIQNNHIIHPADYGIVIGGGAQYSDFQILSNTIEINSNSVIGILFQGNVTNALIAGNRIAADSPRPRSVEAIAFKRSGNANNKYNFNQIDSGFGVARPDNTSCMFSNIDQQGNPIVSLPNTQRTACISDGR